MSQVRRFLLALSFCMILFAAEPVSDDALYDQVRLRLVRDADVQGGAIEVKVNKGVVELSGNVLRKKQRDKAEKLAQKVKGVQSVINNLKIEPAPPRT